MNIEKLQRELYEEGLEDHNQFKKLDAVLDWIEMKRRECRSTTQEVGLNHCEGWIVDPLTGNVSHQSGKFFTILGIKISGADREVKGWSQPMIKQNECGILGILCKKFNGVRHYLFYAKFEPGNMPLIQLSPTLQATASNLLMAHGGKKPLFAEYFEDTSKVQVLTNVEGVEDGGRFYLKTNRSMVVETDADVNVPHDYIWLTMYQIKKLMRMDGMMNSLARSVIASLI